MNDVSIFFNFTSTIFEKSDPLMGLVNVEEPILFYDRLSLGGFSKKPEEREDYIDSLIYDMQNMLESRSLSNKDKNGRIRLIVAIDLAKGICPPNEKAKYCFPAQNASYFKERIAQAFSGKTFDEEHRLSERFNYCFIFLDSSGDEQKLTRMYREAAYPGYSKANDVNWITEDMMGKLAEKISKLQADKFSNILSSESKKEHVVNEHLFVDFGMELDTLLEDEFSNEEPNVQRYLNEVGMLGKFQSLLKEKFEKCKTVAEIKKINFGEAVRFIVTLLMGIGSEKFTDSTFFLLRVKNSPDREKKIGEFYFKSLIQLVATIDETSYRDKFLPPPVQHMPWYYTMDIAHEQQPEDFINEDEFHRLGRYAKQCEEKLGYLIWTEKDKIVTFQHYELNTSDPKYLDSYGEINDKLSDIRSKKRKAFMEARKVPFFFGSTVNDWKWYKEVMATVWDIYKFEKENDRPKYDTPKRITDGQMKATETITCSYSELKTQRDNLEQETVEKIPMEDYKIYQKERHAEMNQFAKAIEDLKAEMVKLGIFSRLLWISIISSIVFALYFFLHYIYIGFEDSYLWIVAGLIGISLLFVSGIIIAQAKVKTRIRSAYGQIDHICEKLQKLLDSFLMQVNKRAEYQNKADVRKRNLDEMNAKLSVLSSHNKQVQLWENFYAGITSKINDSSFKKDTKADNPDDDMVSGDKLEKNLSHAPSILYKIREEFKSMKSQIAGADINNVTCFVTRFNFKRIPQ